MARRLSVCVLPVLLALATCAHADEVEVAPDRPDVTNSTRTVPRGAAQLESGLDFSSARQAGRHVQQELAIEGSLRIGLTERLEVRLDGGPIITLRDGDDSDHGSLAFGLKYRFLDQQSAWPSLGVQPFVRIPFAPAGSGWPDFGALALASWEMPLGLSLDVNAGITAVAQAHPDGYLVQALASASFAKEITERLSGYVELHFASRGERDGRNSLGFDTGLAYLLTRRVAFDVAVGTSLVGPGPDYSIKAGVSVLFGR